MSRMRLAIHGWFRTCEARISLICIRSSSNAPIVRSRLVNGSIQTTHGCVPVPGRLEASNAPIVRSHPVNELIAAYTDNTLLCLSLEGSKLPWSRTCAARTTCNRTSHFRPLCWWFTSQTMTDVWEKFEILVFDTCM